MATQPVKAIGILGGVGPEAGCLLHQHLLAHSKQLLKPDCDQQHLPVFHLSLSPMISDRTEFLLNPALENPAQGAYQALQIFNQIAASFGKIAIGIPCNTFHATPIFDVLIEKMQRQPLPHVELLHMIEETALALKTNGQSPIGLLSTTGTRHIRLYQNCFEQLGLRLIEVPETMQDQVHQSIYDTNWGIKSSQHQPERTLATLMECVDVLQAQGVEQIILGCTELPLVLTENVSTTVDFIDPMDVLAKRLVGLFIE